jgi:hypothetical protein
MRTYALSELAGKENVLPFASISERGSFFAQPAWFKLIEDCYIGTGSAATIVAREGRSLAIACLRRGGDRVLRSCTNLYTTEFDLIGDDSDTPGVCAFVEELVRSGDRLEYIRLEGLNPSANYFGAFLKGLQSAGWAAKSYFGWAQWREDLAGIDFQNYLSSRASVLQNTWRRKQSLAAKSAALRWQFHRMGDGPEPLIALYENVRQRSWKKAEPFPDFIPNLIRLAARMNALRMGILFVDDVPAAAQFWLAWAGRATIYKLVYAQEFAKFSPGTLLTMEMMRCVLEQDKPVEIDFGRGDDDYKKLWLSSRSERWGIEAANPRTLKGFPRSLWIMAGEMRAGARRNDPAAARNHAFAAKPARVVSQSVWPGSRGITGLVRKTYLPN